ncbi:hypothetical protein PENTCL1PPCAC_18111, partial [Pristionchus entomophagus]
IEHPQTFSQDVKAPQFKSIEHLVEYYVKYYRSSLMNSSKKRVFLGASLGSLLAFEMASQLGVEEELIVIDGRSNQEPTPSLNLDDHRSMMIDIVGKYKVKDNQLIDHMISHSWHLNLLSRDYKPRRNELISVHVFSICGTDLHWSEIALVKSVHRLTGDHSLILNSQNSSLITDFLRSLF